MCARRAKKYKTSKKFAMTMSDEIRHADTANQIPKTSTTTTNVSPSSAEEHSRDSSSKSNSSESFDDDQHGGNSTIFEPRVPEKLSRMIENVHIADLDHPDYWLAAVMRNRYLNEQQMHKLCRMVGEILIEEPNVVEVTSPCTVVGDIHGQFYDLRHMFDITDLPNNTKYVFLGDYVDRGYYSLETLTLLLVLKIKNPQQIILLRGNHESRTVTQTYGFQDECMRKYGSAIVWRKLCSIFDLLPIASIIDNSILCIHGGLSPFVKTIDRIHAIDRNAEIPNCGTLCHLLWSDPDTNLREEWGFSPRGAGVLFGEIAHYKFCKENNIELVCRAHQLVEEGFRYYFNDTLATVWSAPNYCYRNGNLASVLELNQGERNIKIFNAVPDNQRKTPNRIMIPYFL